MTRIPLTHKEIADNDLPEDWDQLDDLQDADIINDGTFLRNGRLERPPQQRSKFLDD